MKNISSIFLITFTITLVFIFYSKNTKSQGVEWLNGFISGSGASINSVTSDNNGNIIAVGTFFTSVSIGNQVLTTPGSGYSVLVAKFNSNGALTWANTYSSLSNDNANAVVCDDNGNIYVAGTFQNSINFGSFTLTAFATNNPENFLIKLNSNGTVIWAKGGGRADNSTFGGFNFSLHYNNGHVYFLGKYYNDRMTSTSTLITYSNNFDGDTLLMSPPTTNTLNRNILISKIDTNGTKAWTKSWLRANSASALSFGGIKVSSNGDVFCSVNSNTNVSNTIDTLSFTNTFAGFTILKLDNNGNPITQFSAQSLSNQNYLPLIEMVNDNIYLLNSTNVSVNLGSFNSNGLYLAKFTSNLSVYQVHNLSTFNLIFPSGITFTQDSKIAFTGRINGTASLGGINQNAISESFVVKIDTLMQSADFFEVSQHISTPSQFSQSYGITSLNADEIVIGGRLQNGHVFGYFTHNGNFNDGYIAKYVNCKPLQNNFITPPNPVICGNSTVTLNTNVNNNPIFNIQWLNNGSPISGATNPNYSASNLGNYSVYVDSLGCRDTSSTVTVTVGTAVNVTVSPSSQSVCGGSSSFTLTGGSPVGGVWSGTGVVNDSIFNPQLAGAGTHLLTYTYINPSGCSATASRVITVQPLPSVFIFPFSSVCQSDSPFSIVNNGFPQGGTFTGNGVVGGTQFDPSIAGAGVHTLTYTYTDIFGCQASTTANITVNPAPSVSTQAFNPVCQSTFSISLTGGAPSGGTWSGNFVVSNQFYPFLSGPGTYNLVYSVTQNGCTASDTQSITVDPPAVANITAQNNVCINSGNITLNGTPSGGTYIGNGVSGNTFNPTVAGIGSHLVRYAISNACGTDTASITINVNPLPLVGLNAFSTVCVNTTPFTLSGGSPLGGTFSGNGVSGNTFSPALAGVGTHNITYSFTDANGCSNTATQNIAVLGIPTVSLTLQDSICLNASPITLNSGTPIGGTYSGAGISGNTFNPASAGVGTHAVVYTFSDTLGCSNADTQFITVFDPAPPVWTSPGSVCISSSSISLSGANPSGGTFSGNGISANDFNPSVAGVGLHTITYTISTSCGNRSTSDTIRVHPLPTVNFSALPSVCATASTFTLSGGSPIGGTYSGNGVSGNQFNPSVAGVGTHTISYTYTDANSCANTATQTITVTPPPTVSLTLPDTICLNSGILNLNSGTPIGGSYSGNGVSGNTFSPLLAGVGTHIISYSYTDGGGCSNTATDTITVYDPANPTWSAPSAVCISSGSISLSAGNPSGGSFSGTGVSGNTFNPSLAGVGLHTITYTISTPCGNRSTSDTIRVNPLPTVNFSALSPVCVSANAFTLSGGTPAGGTYSGNGVSGNQFNPTVAGVGTHTITYTYSDANSCTNTSSQSITVYALPTISFSLPDSVCQNASAIILSASPSGGTFTGPGVASGIFTPASAGIGTHSIVYNYTDANSCSASDTQTITVHTSPVSWSAPAAVCISVNSVPLSTGIPSGGTFSGSGVMGNNFIPLMAGIGVHTITYTVSTACGTNSVSDTIRVHALPSVNLTSLSPVCVSANAFALLGGSPSGGTYSGNGVSGNSFNPAVAGVGTHTITYTFTNANGCSNSSTQNITVNASPTVNLTPISPVCVDAGSIALSGGTPVGGTYSGTGVSGSNFNPLVAGVGTHTITYTFTNSNGCSASASQNIVVNALPTVSLNSVAPLCVDAASVSLSGTPTGGSFSGNGVTGNSFNPAVAGVGVHPVIYTFTDGNSCSASDTQNVTVNALPNVSLNSLSSVCINALPVTLSGGSPTGGVFSGNGVSAGQFNPQTAGIGSHTITYSFTDANSCSASDAQSIVVNDTTLLSFNGPITLCNNDSLAALNWVNPSGGSYSGNFINNNLLNLDSVPSGVNNFNYTFVNASGCTSTLNDVFTILPRPNVSHSALDSLCGNSEPYVLSGGLPSGGTYAGSGVSNNIFNQRNAGGPGNYFISYTVSDSNGCSNSILLPIYVGATPNLNVTRGAEICEGDSVRISASGASSYQWSTNERTASIMVNPTTTSTYFVTGSNPDGCSNTDSVLVVVNPLPIINLGNDTVICLGNTLGLDAGNGFRFYNWNTGANTQQITVPQSSDSVGSFTYIVVVEDLNGCLGADSIQVSVQNCTGIELRDLSSFFNLYPNPSNGNFNIDIQWPVSEEVEIILTTTTGRLVFTQKQGLTNARQQIAFNEHLANGVYFISIKGKAGVAQKRVMVNK